jgi:hypothetical protein
MEGSLVSILVTIEIRKLSSDDKLIKKALFWRVVLMFSFVLFPS